MVVESEDLEGFASAAGLNGLPLDKVEERLRRVSRTVKNRIDKGRGLRVLGIGNSGMRHLPVLKRYLESEGIDTEEGRIDTAKPDATGYMKVSTTDLLTLNPDGRKILLLDNSVREGETMYSALRWILENDSTLNLSGQDDVSVITLVDSSGISNVCLNPKVSSPKGPRASFLEDLEKEEDGKKKRTLAEEQRNRLRDKATRHLNGEVYSFGRDPDWRERLEKWEVYISEVERYLHSLDWLPWNIKNKIEELENVRKNKNVLEIVSFINGYPSSLSCSPQLQSQNYEITDDMVETVVFLSWVGEVLRGLKLECNSFSSELVSGMHFSRVDIVELSKQLLTDKRVLVAEKYLGTDTYFEIAKELTKEGNREADNFRFVTVDPFKMYTVSDLFLEAFNRGLPMTPSDLGQDVADYCQRERQGLNYKPECVVATRSSRVYGMGLTLDLGLPRDRYVEIENGLTTENVLEAEDRSLQGRSSIRVYPKRVREVLGTRFEIQD